MRYVIRKSDGMFVAPPGQRGSYTPLLQKAWTFYTRETAEANRCPGNERVLSVDQVMAGE